MRRWLDILAAAACFLCGMCPALSPAAPSQPPAHDCSTPCTADTATTLDSMDGPPTSICSALLGSPLCPPSHFLGPVFPVVDPSCLACLVLPTRSAMARFPFLIGMSLPPPLGLLPVLLLPRLRTVMMKVHLVSHIVLLWFHVMVMLRFLPCALAFHAFAPSLPLLLFALNLPRRLAAAADALSGMVSTDLLPLLLHYRSQVQECAFDCS
jgi:hypothetical protein